MNRRGERAPRHQVVRLLVPVAPARGCRSACTHCNRMTWPMDSLQLHGVDTLHKSFIAVLLFSTNLFYLEPRMFWLRLRRSMSRDLNDGMLDGMGTMGSIARCFLTLLMFSSTSSLCLPSPCLYRRPACLHASRIHRPPASRLSSTPADETTVESLRTRIHRALPQGGAMDKRIGNVLIPCAVSFLVVPLTNAVDTAWIGRMGDPLALAGQGAANSVFSTAFFMVSFLPTVMAPLVASAVGKGDLDAARDRIAETMFLSTIFGVLGMIALAFFPRVCLGLVLTSHSPALPHAESYLWVRSLSLLPALWASVGFAAFRGAQDTKTPLRISIGSNLFNAIVDPILIFTCSLGTYGSLHENEIIFQGQMTMCVRGGGSW